MFLIRIIILFFILLLGFQIYCIMQTTKEGLVNATPSTTSTVTAIPVGTTNSSLTYQPYNNNDPNSALILSQQNAGNIEYLKSRITDLQNSSTKIDSMSQNMSSMQTQIDALVQQQTEYAKSLSTPAPADSEEN